MEGSSEKQYENEIYTERVAAGKRTYFFDIRATRGGDKYITITESKRKTKGVGFYYEKHKIFLYKEDFDKFNEGLSNAIGQAKKHLSQSPSATYSADAGSTQQDSQEAD